MERINEARIDVVRSFLEDALKDENNPVLKVAKKQVSSSEGTRFQSVIHTPGVNILGAYLIFPGSTMDKIGETYGGISRQAVNQIIDRTLKEIWKASTPDLKNKYPLNSLREGRLTKPRQLKGVNAEVNTLLQEGLGIGEIRDRLKLDGTVLGGARKVLRDHNIDLGYLNKRSKDVIKKLNEAVDDIGIQESLDALTPAMLDYFRSKKPGFIIPITTLIRNLGFYSRTNETSLFATTLNNAKIPLGTIVYELKKPENQIELFTYRFIFYKQTERAEAAWMEDQALMRFRQNPVVQICGLELEDLPTTTMLLRSSNFAALKSIFEEIGIPAGTRSLRIIDFLSDDCPVRVFKASGAYFHDPKDTEILKEFIRNRWQEMNIE